MGAERDLLEALARRVAALSRGRDERELTRDLATRLGLETRPDPDGDLGPDDDDDLGLPDELELKSPSGRLHSRGVGEVSSGSLAIGRTVE
jgi:hypothetical protein